MPKERRISTLRLIRDLPPNSRKPLGIASVRCPSLLPNPAASIAAVLTTKEFHEPFFHLVRFDLGASQVLLGTRDYFYIEEGKNRISSPAEDLFLQLLKGVDAEAVGVSAARGDGDKIHVVGNGELSPP